MHHSPLGGGAIARLLESQRLKELHIERSAFSRDVMMIECLDNWLLRVHVLPRGLEYGRVKRFLLLLLDRERGLSQSSERPALRPFRVSWSWFCFRCSLLHTLLRDGFLCIFRHHCLLPYHCSHLIIFFPFLSIWGFLPRSARAVDSLFSTFNVPLVSPFLLVSADSIHGGLCFVQARHASEASKLYLFFACGISAVILLRL